MATGGQDSTNPFSQGYNDRFTGEQQAPSRLDHTQRQVQEVVTIMRSNVEKVMERDSRLSDLESRADTLSSSAQMFERRAVQVRKKMWWNNMKWKLILGLVAILVVVGIGFWIASATKSSGGGNDSKSLPSVDNNLHGASSGPSNSTK